MPAPRDRHPGRADGVQPSWTPEERQPCRRRKPGRTPAERMSVSRPGQKRQPRPGHVAGPRHVSTPPLRSPRRLSMKERFDMADPKTRREPAARLRSRTKPDGTPFDDEPDLDERADDR